MDFFLFLPDELRSEGWASKIATVDIAFIPVSCAAKNVGNVQPRRDLAIYTNKREQSFTFFLPLFSACERFKIS